MKTNECHNCPYDRKRNEQCLKCQYEEQYSYKYKKYVLDTYDPPEPEKQEPEQVTDLDQDTEDKFRKALYDLFDLSNNELLMLKYIMNRKSLIEYARDMEKTSQSNQKFSRFRSFQTRKSLLKKLGPVFSQALLTTGQKKPIKA